MKLRSETFANVSIGVMCLSVSYAAVDRYVLSKTVAAETRPESGFKTGERVSTDLEQLQLGTAKPSAVVVVSNTCHFCVESADFYRRLASLEKGAGGRFQALFLGMHGTEDAERFVTTQRLSPTQARPTPSDVQARVPGTPTLLLVDARGRVTQSWVGKLTQSQEEDVIAAVSRTIRGA
jgi:hypothetical protein